MLAAKSLQLFPQELLFRDYDDPILQASVVEIWPATAGVRGVLWADSGGRRMSVRRPPDIALHATGDVTGDWFQNALPQRARNIAGMSSVNGQTERGHRIGRTVRLITAE